jgi:hypothetical protein
LSFNETMKTARSEPGGGSVARVTAMTPLAKNLKKSYRMVYKNDRGKCLYVMTPKSRLLFFILVFGIVAFLLLSFVEIDPFYAATARILVYLVFLLALGVYVAVAVIWEKFRNKKTPLCAIYE